MQNRHVAIRLAGEARDIGGRARYVQTDAVAGDRARERIHVARQVLVGNAVLDECTGFGTFRIVVTRGR